MRALALGPLGMGLMLVGAVLRVAPLVGVLADATSLRAALVVVLLSRTLSGAAR